MLIVVRIDRREWVQRRRWLVVGWVALLIVTVALVPDLSEGAGDSSMMEPWHFGRPASVTAVLVSIPVLSLSVRALWRVRRAQQALWHAAIGVFLGTAIGAAVGYRTLTAAVHGANIGGGMFVVFGLALMALALVLSVFLAHRSRRVIDAGSPINP